MARLLIIV